MQIADTPKELGKNAVGDGLDVHVTTRLKFLDNVGIPIAGLFFLFVGLFVSGRELIHIAEDGFRQIPWGDQQVWSSLAWVGYFLSCTVFLVFGSLWNKAWLLRRTCTYHVDFGSGQLDCNDPERLATLTLGDILSAQPYTSHQSVVYRINTPTGVLAVCSTFEDMADWITSRFNTHSISESLHRIDFSRPLSARQQTLLALVPLCPALILLPSSLCTMYFAAGVSGMSAFSSEAVVPIFLSVFLLVVGYFCLVPKYSMTLTGISLGIFSRTSPKHIPFDSIREISAKSTGFTLTYEENGVGRHAGVGQRMYAESLLPVYFTLCSRASGACLEKGDAVAVDVTGVPIP